MNFILIWIMMQSCLLYLCRDVKSKLLNSKLSAHPLLGPFLPLLLHFLLEILNGLLEGVGSHNILNFSLLSANRATIVDAQPLLQLGSLKIVPTAQGARIRYQFVRNWAFVLVVFCEQLLGAD